MKPYTIRELQPIVYWGLLAAAVAVLFPSVFVWGTTRAQSSTELSDLPADQVVLVLGTAARIGTQANNYFTFRIDAAERLYKAGKVKCFLLSGANPSKYYNEPKDMKEALMARGVPAEMIVLDFAGLRTLDSVVRAKEVFSAPSVTIVSQAFHNHRALYIANHIGLPAQAYHAQDVQAKYSIRIKIREVLARVRVLLDLHITNTKPKFLGEQQALPL